MPSLVKSLASKYRNIGVYVISLISAAVGIALNFLLARILEAENYGKIQYLFSLCTLLANVCVFGLNTFLIREAKNEKQNNNVFNKCLTLYFCIFVFIGPILFFLLHNVISGTSFDTILSISVVTVSFLMGIVLLFSGYYQGKGDFQISVIIENFLPKAILLIIALVFVIIGEMSGFQTNYLFFYAGIYFVIALPLCIKTVRSFNLKFSKAELVSILFFFGLTVSYNLGGELAKVLQGGLYKNNVALATISISMSIVNLVVVFTEALNNFVRPIFAKHSRENNREELANVFRFNTRMDSYIAIPFYLFFIVFSKTFLSMFGESYTSYPIILSLIAASSLFATITGPCGYMLAMSGYEKWELFNGISYLAIYISCIFIFSFDKVYGLTIGLLISKVLINLFKYLEVYKVFKGSPLDVKSLLTILVILITNFGVIFLLTFIHNFVIWLIVGILVGASLILLNIFVISPYRKNDFKYLLSLRV